MAQIPSDSSSLTDGLYAWLADREEQAHQRPNRTLDWSPVQPAYTGRPERLEALRAGAPVDLWARDLPPWARPEGACRASSWLVAIVAPDGTVRFEEGDASRWLAENGL